ncbi:putative CheA signal transduction histidine kinase [Xylanimonas cellulosilytica DSM 15894]|uniref:CheA signal transduction histidine kinase n=1 Tax=Xylanimonas cellulosilytica (strain DSM 15894 / JCM 12276 / CECT 5975 / KCTC 9989 / LMG 20990 / NBRC 107835 / XIL07) TaxID=446471 RepID=D1C056_XYLCX|nr:excalibur calcium-binding domain-containing protein [Xylanimonas cellulosilytica]ACZ30245.1 putative CheA signal transduction histidine kinase [Xylanimonas cellulosilytica DSM 15894]
MTKATAPTRLGVFRRHKILTAVGGTTALVVVLGIAGTLAGNDAAAIAAVVEKSQVTSASIDTASSDLSDALEEARILADQTSDEIADPAHHDGLLEAIEAAEAVAAEQAAQATTEMTLEEAEAAHAGALALLARLDTARDPLRAAMDAASQSHQTYLAEALTEAKARHADSQAALALTMPAAEQVLAESEGKVGDDAVRTALRAALDDAQSASAALTEEVYTSYRDAATRNEEADREVAAASGAVTAAVDAKAAADKAAAEKAAAEKAAAEKAAAERAAAERAAAEKAAAEARASSASSAGSSQQAPSGGSAYYKNCTAARNAGAAPVRVGEPGYGRHLDRDGDGIGCE